MASPDGFDLRLALPRAEQKIFGESARTFKVQNYDVAGLLILRGFDGQADFGAKRVQCHRYRACP